MGCRKLGVIVVVGGLGLALAGSAYADAITYDTQIRSVTAHVDGHGFCAGGHEYGVVDPGAEPIAASERFWGFRRERDGHIHVRSGKSDGDIVGVAAILVERQWIQRQRQRARGFRPRRGSRSGQSAANTAFDIRFDVSQAEPYTFDMNLNSTVDPAVPGNTSASISLTNAQGVNVFAPITR